MKKTWKKVFAFVLALAMMLTTFTVTGTSAAAEEDGYLFFLGMGGHNDWSLCYHGPDATDDNDAIVATTAMVKAGDTVTIGLELPSESDQTWWLAPTLVAEANITTLDYTINSILIDGVDVLADVDLAAGDAWWYEGTGPYEAEKTIRLAGGYNEWGTKYMAEGPANFTKIEYNVTFNEIVVSEAAAGEETLSHEEYPAFIAFGGNNDWSMQYYGENNAGNSGDVKATNGVLKTGETTVLSLEFGTKPDCTWFVAPCMIVDDTAAIGPSTSFDVKVFVDGAEVDCDLTAGDLFWAEGTGDYTEAQCIRIAGGFNEWATQYISGPKDFSKIEFHITPTIYTQEVVVEEAPQYDFDPNGTYHAYLGVQTPTWIFRNSWDDAAYGLATDYFGELGFVDGTDWVAQGGKFTDVEITGNGTYTVKLEGFDFSGEFRDDGAILGADGVFNLLFLSTDLPVNDAVVLSNLTLKMDGKEITTMAEPFFNPDKKEIQEALFANIWNKEISALPYYAAPKESIEITFTVSGFAKDAVIEEPAVEEPAAEEPAAEASGEAETTEAVSTETEAGNNTVLIIVVIAVVVIVVAAGAGVVVAKKKKESK